MNNENVSSKALGCPKGMIIFHNLTKNRLGRIKSKKTHCRVNNTGVAWKRTNE